MAAGVLHLVMWCDYGQRKLAMAERGKKEYIILTGKLLPKKSKEQEDEGLTKGS